jgi:ribosomal protein S18 acetylase RimI-like enzyme
MVSSAMRSNARSIRRAHPEDAAALVAAEREIARIPGRLASQPNELQEDAFRDEIVKLNARDGGIYLVAEQDGKIVGHALLKSRELAATSHVVGLTIAVHEGHQGKGVGRALMNELVAWSKSNPRVEKIELHVRSSNERAIALYRSFDFVEEGRITKRIKIGSDDYLDDVCMGLWLGP